jgi:hypothetical protein
VSSKYVGPGKPFATEEEEFAEHIAFLEWWTQTPEKEREEFVRNLEGYLRSIGQDPSSSPSPSDSRV